jgi:pimeloyl-ACP methyl ester carboxylesterase
MIMNKRICRKVSVEGDDLFYKITGSGVPLLLIPGGGGNGDSFLPLADVLFNKYKVITYDRRANARSTANNLDSFSVIQQSSDALAILKAVGEESAFIFGNSSGGIIALELIKNFPEAVRMAIIHEPPLANYANNSKKWLKFFDDCYQLALNKGSDNAAAKFGMGVTGRMTIAPLLSDIKLKAYLRKEPKQPGESHLPEKLADEIFMKLELIPVTSYLTDIEILQKYRDKLIFASGNWTVHKKVWFAEVAKKLSEEIGSKLIIMPGGHVSFIDKPKEWAKLLDRNFS